MQGAGQLAGVSLGLASVVTYCCALVAIWLVGMLSPRFSRGRLSLVAASMLLLPGLAVFLDAPVHLLGIDGEESWGLLILAAPAFLFGLIGLTLALVNWSRFHPYGFKK